MTTKKIPKSGKVGIRLSEKDVKILLERSAMPQQIERRFRKAVEAKFTNMTAENVERNKIRDITDSLRTSDDVKKMYDKFSSQRHELNIQYDRLAREEAEEFQKLVQAKMDEAGIKLFKAKGYGFILVETNA